MKLVAWIRIDRLGQGRLSPGRRGLKPKISNTLGVLLILSPFPRKAWIETRVRLRIYNKTAGRLSPGRRGLKPVRVLRYSFDRSSPFPRKAWIETQAHRPHPTDEPSRLSPGRRGLKQTSPTLGIDDESRLSPGRRGLKRHDLIDPRLSKHLSPFPRKAWIETCALRTISKRRSVAFPPEGVD